MWLSILDKEPYIAPSRVQTKGGHQIINPEYIVFTSILHPDSWMQSYNKEDSGKQYTTRLQMKECTRVRQRQQHTSTQAAADALAALDSENESDEQP